MHPPPAWDFSHPQCTETGHFDVQNGKIFLRRGHSPLTRPLPRGEGDTPPHTPSPLLRELHWLGSPERVDYKLAVLVFRCLNGLAPRYLSNHIQRVAESNGRCLRSSSSSLLVTYHRRRRDRAFPCSLRKSCLCNCLPGDVTSASTLAVFRKRLKTFLFSLSFTA